MVTKIGAKEYTKLEGHKQGVYALFWSDREQVLVSAGGDGSVVKWSVPLDGKFGPGGVVGVLFAQLPEPIFCLMEGLDGAIWAGSQGGNLYVLRAKSAPRVMALGSTVFFIQRWMDGKIAVGLGSGALVFLDDEMQLLDRVVVSQKSLRCCLGERGLVGGSEGCIWKLDAEGGVLQRFEANSPSVFCLYALGDGGWVSGGRDALLWWFGADGGIKEKVKAHMNTIHALVGYGDGVMVSGGMDKMVKVWDGVEAKLLKVLDKQKFPGTGHSHSVNALCRLPALEQRGERRLLASAGDDKIIRIWELQTNLP
jgi:WD repeat-containing protein 61